MSKQVTVTMRLTEDEREQLKQKADACSLSVNEYMHAQLLQETQKVHAPAPKNKERMHAQTVFSDSLDAEGLQMIGKICRNLWTGKVTNAVNGSKKPYSPENPYRKIQIACNYYFKDKLSNIPALTGNMTAEEVEFINSEVM